MRRLLISLLLVLSPSILSAQTRHYIAPASGELPPGAEVVRPLAGGRQLVRVAADAVVDASFERLTAEKKIDRRALRAATAGKPFTSVTVQFHDDVRFEAARQAIYAAGGTVEDPLQHGFDAAMRVRARIPSMSLLDLAANESVLIVFGPRNLRREPHNRTTADMSDVTPLHSAPYDLTGAGVVLSFFEFAPADASHSEFEGRLTTHLTGTNSGEVEHATHVAGTMIAAGKGGSLGAAAKGMAPQALLHQFSASGDEVLNRKENLPTFAVVADNNSWGFVLGWCTSPSCTEGWVWDDTEEYYGAYDSFYVAPLDRISRTANILFVHSAGNDAGKRGPQAAPFAHRHTDDQGDVITGTFCYSANGSGTDCPSPACTAGNAPSGAGPYCETQRHPEIISELPAPYGSLGLTASAKNVLSVGAIDSSQNIASFSSRGPARDGRVKPELVARGVGVYSLAPTSSCSVPPCYSNKQGTSMSAPAVTGMAALVTEQWRRTFAGQNPGSAVLRTMLIAGAEDIGLAGPDYTTGFGMANAKNSVDLIIADGGVGRRIKRGALNQGGTFEVPVTVTAGQNLRVVLGWLDPEVIIFPSDGLATATLVNDLDVKVITPSGNTVLPYVLDKSQPTQAATRGVNMIDNVEMLEIAGAAAGEYRVVVTGSRITARAPQEFVLVANADLDADEIPCVDETNNSEASARVLPSGVEFTGRGCAAGDNDYFTFVATAPGTVTVRLTAGDTAMRATITGAAASASVDAPAGTTRTVSFQHGTTPLTYFVRVEPVGTIGAEANYAIEVDYPFSSGPRRRVVGR